MIAVATWSNANQGYPNLFGPTGTANGFDGWQWRGTNRVGPAWAGSGDEGPLNYTSCVGIAGGRMVWGTAQEGLLQVSQALPTDVPLPANYAAGQKKYMLAGRNLTHGVRGFGYYGLSNAAVWDSDPDIATFLSVNGQVRS